MQQSVLPARLSFCRNLYCGAFLVQPAGDCHVLANTFRWNITPDQKMFKSDIALGKRYVVNSLLNLTKKTMGVIVSLSWFIRMLKNVKMKMVFNILPKYSSVALNYVGIVDGNVIILIINWNKNKIYVNFFTRGYVKLVKILLWQIFLFGFFGLTKASILW